MKKPEKGARLKLNKSEKEYWNTVEAQLVEVVGFSKVKARRKVRELVKYLVDVATLNEAEPSTSGDDGIEYTYYPVLACCLHAEPCHWTFKLSEVENVKPVGTCAYDETTEYHWVKDNKEALERIQ